MAKRPPKRKSNGAADDSNSSHDTTHISLNIDPGVIPPTAHTMAERPPKRKRTGASDDSNVSDDATQTSPDIEPRVTSPTSHDRHVTNTNFTKADLVTLLVGHEELELVTHGHRLADSSDFFRTVLKKDWKEGQTRVVRLPEEDVSTVRQYLTFVHSNFLDSRRIERASDFAEEDNICAVHFLCVLYVFAERMLDSVLRNAIVTEQVRLASLCNDNGGSWYPGWDSARVIYKGTPAGSPMRRFMVDILVAHSAARDFDGLDMHDCPQLPMDIATKYAKMAERGENPKEGWLGHCKSEDYFVWDLNRF